MCRKTVLALLILFLAGSVLGFPASMKAVNRDATQSEPARFDVEITNNISEARGFSLSVSSPKQSWIYLDRPRTVQPGEQATLSMYVTPPENAVQQNIGFDLTVKTSSGKSKSFQDYFTVKREHSLDITSMTKNNQSFRPGGTVSFDIDVLNTAPEIVENYTVKITTSEWSISEQGIKIAPGGETTLQLAKQLPERSSPGEKSYEVFVTRNGKKGDAEKGSFSVRKVVDLERTETETDRVLYYSRQVSVHNRGNTVETVKLNESFPSYLEPIAAFSPDPDRVTGEGSKEIIWTAELKPGESQKFSYSVNYWAPLAVLAALLSGILFANRMRRKLEFSKKAVREGEEVKIHVEIENRSNHSLHKVRIEDFVPDIASVNKDFPFAKPVIRKTGSGTRLSWEMEELEPGDQRVFEYSIKPQVEVEGKVELPSAEISSEGRKLSETSKAEAEFTPRDT